MKDTGSWVAIMCLFVGVASAPAQTPPNSRPNVLFIEIGRAHV